jgi:uncharacterized membrane protein YdbT with pleckstrin-like domain
VQVEVRASSRRPRTQTGTDSAIGRIAAAHAQREERQKKKKQEEEKAERSRKKRQQQDEEEEEQEEEEEEEEEGGRCLSAVATARNGLGMLDLCIGKLRRDGMRVGGRGASSRQEKRVHLCCSCQGCYRCLISAVGSCCRAAGG